MVVLARELLADERRDRAIKELTDRVQVLTKHLAEVEQRMNKCKCGCCRP